MGSDSQSSHPLSRHLHRNTTAWWSRVTEKPINDWHRQGTQKPVDTYNQPKRHNSQSHHRVPSRKKHKTQVNNPYQHSTPARLHHSNPWTTSRRPSRVITGVLSDNTTQCSSQAGRPALQNRHHPHQRGHAACRPPREPYTAASLHRARYPLRIPAA